METNAIKLSGFLAILQSKHSKVMLTQEASIGIRSTIDLASSIDFSYVKMTLLLRMAFEVPSLIALGWRPRNKSGD